MKLREGEAIVSETIKLIEKRLEAAGTHRFVPVPDPKNHKELDSYNVSTYKWYICEDCGILAYQRWIVDQDRWTDKPIPFTDHHRCKDNIIKDIIE